MAGAIIPDDWDGSTFECQRIEWPASPLWQAILLGQVTEPGWSSYWDADTGDVDAAAQAAKDAYRLTIPAIYAEGCDEVPALVTAYMVETTSLFAMPPFTMTTVEFAAYIYQWNNPGFDFADFSHRPDLVGKSGMWHYDVQVRFQPDVLSQYRARAWIPQSSQEIARVENSRPYLSFSFDWWWGAGGYDIVIQAWAAVATTIRTGIGETFWDGSYLGPVVE